MKIRKGFVTNSSSTNFGASSASALAATATELILGEQPEEETVRAMLMVKIKPNKASVLTDGKMPISIYAQVRVKDEMNVWQVDKGATEGIEFSFNEECWDWVSQTYPETISGYRAIAFVAVNPYASQPKEERPKPPEAVRVTITAPGAEYESLQRTASFKLVDFADDDENVKLQIKTIPSVSKIKLGDPNPVQFCAQLRYRDGMGVWQNNDEVSEGINIEFVGESENWVTKSETSFFDHYLRINFIAETPYSDRPRKLRPPSPEKIKIKANVDYEDKTYEKIWSIDLIGEPGIKTIPDDLQLVYDHITEGEIKIKFVNVENVIPQIECNVRGGNNLIDIDNSEDSSIIKVSLTGQEKPESYGSEVETIEIKAVCDQFEIEDECEVSIAYEGLFYVPQVRQDPAVKIVADSAKKNGDDEFPPYYFDLKLTKWDEASQKIVETPADLSNIVFEEFECENECIENMFNESEFVIEPDEIRDGRSMKFKAYAKRSVPNKSSNSVKGSISAIYKAEDKDYSVRIPLKLIPEYFQDNSYEEEYNNCVYIIKRYYPEEGKDKKLQELENLLGKVCIEDLRIFRKEAWDEACEAIQNEASYEMRKAQLLTAAIWGLEAARFMGDRAFNFLIGQLTGPLGAYAAGQLKDATVDFINLAVSSDKQGMDFVWEYVSNELLPRAAGTIDSTIFANMDKLKENKSKFAAWITAMFIYKVGYHYYVTKTEEGTDRPLGIWGSIKNAAYDIAGVGVEAWFSGTMADMIKKSPDFPMFNTLKLKVRERKLIMDGKKLIADVSKEVKETLSDEETIKEFSKIVAEACVYN